MKNIRKFKIGENIDFKLKYMGPDYDLVQITCKFNHYEENKREPLNIGYELTIYSENTPSDMHYCIEALLLKVNDIKKEYYTIPQELLKSFGGKKND